ncbi:interleukin-10 [Mastacembelus armatus]|uniref:Interleukin family protein n=1 Tax=Mastacembelus armatus TaxID=205130 RepID=A0A3Q3LQH8_9TELE|nr:interleukin-10 [Mastacembelus armatus]
MLLSLLSSSARSSQGFSSQKSENFIFVHSDTEQHLHSCTSLQPQDFSSSSSSMTPRSLLLSVLVLLSFFSTAWCTPMCNSHCCRFVDNFPVRLRKLRANYSKIRDFYEANNDLETALLDQSIEESLKTPFACHAISSILNFYLSTVLPTAMAGVTEDTKNLKPHMEAIQHIFDEVKCDVIKCRNYFSCKNHFDIKNLNATYTQMQSKGLYKAVSELDVLFNYIETYLASKRRGNRGASM